MLNLLSTVQIVQSNATKSCNCVNCCGTIFIIFWHKDEIMQLRKAETLIGCVLSIKFTIS
jgi:hypothetical protein